MAKLKFPTKPCPKCNEPIHARLKKHEKCGWSADTMPAAARATKPTAAKSAHGAAASDKPANKMDAVRRILGESGNDTKPADIATQLKQKFRIAMSLAMISNYKSVILKKGAKKKLGRPKGSTNAPKAAPAAATRSAAVSLEDIRAVKQLIDQIGADKVRELADVLAK